MDLTMAHISDLHVGSPHFVPHLMNRTIAEVNELEPDVLVASGDFTNEGFRQEYKTALSYLERVECPRKLYVPGNHDSRNVGYMHFEELLGNRFSTLRIGDVTVLAVDSSEPDQNDGRVGREWYPWILENFAEGDPRVRIFVMHHHLLPIPGTGRERSVVFDAGDLLEILVRARTQARAVGLATREHVRRHGRDGVVPASAWSHQALLQRRPRLGGRGEDRPQVAIRRREHHRALLAGHGRPVPSRDRISPQRTRTVGLSPVDLSRVNA